MTRETLNPNFRGAYVRTFLTGIQNTFVYRWNFLLRTVFGIVPLGRHDLPLARSHRRVAAASWATTGSAT
jgi:hypothetical protein